MKRRENPHEVMDPSTYGYCAGQQPARSIGILVEFEKPLKLLDELYLYAHGATRFGKHDTLSDIPYKNTSPAALVRLARRTFVVEMSENRIGCQPRSVL